MHLVQSFLAYFVENALNVIAIIVVVGSHITTLIGGGTPKTSESSYWGGDIPWLSVKDFGNDGKYVYSTEKTITETGLNNSSTKLLKKDDIIISARGTIGAIAMLSSEMAFNQSCFGIRSNELVDQHYLYYLTKTKIAELQKNSHGSVFDTITRETFAKLDCQIPPIELQKVIASILSALDDKIEVNRRINENLEQQAQALFKSWFVDFEPFKNGEFVESELGMIPKGWRVGKLGEICNVFTGKKDVKQSQPIGLYPFFSCSPNHTYSNEYIYDGPSIIIAGNGSYTGRTSFYFGKFDLYQRTYACTIKEGFNEKIIFFLYYMMKCLFEPVKMGGTRGSSIPYIVMNDIVLQKFALDNSLVEKYSDFAYNVMKQIQQNNQESRRLAELRDTLLPKLMSGEMKVNEITND